VFAPKHKAGTVPRKRVLLAINFIAVCARSERAKGQKPCKNSGKPIFRQAGNI
jgi:hypothetical protein